ncbi:hypothetical protein QE443_003036 [Pantoea ananatis]|nr:hypothetical protein [Pantoea ananatis]CRH39327.1 hypothetical protein BN1184_BF_00430 [Pantoea ananatis]
MENYLFQTYSSPDCTFNVAEQSRGRSSLPAGCGQFTIIGIAQAVETQRTLRVKLLA